MRQPPEETRKVGNRRPRGEEQ